jgi:hypothetical protein
MSNRGQPRRGGPPPCGLGEGITIPQRKNQFVTKCCTGPRNWMEEPVVDPSERSNEPSGSIKGGNFLTS